MVGFPEVSDMPAQEIGHWTRETSSVLQQASYFILMKGPRHAVILSSFLHRDLNICFLCIFKYATESLKWGKGKETTIFPCSVHTQEYIFPQFEPWFKLSKWKRLILKSCHVSPLWNLGPP